MTFYQLSVKMLKRNFTQYRLYFGCNWISAVLFFCFACLYFNPQFMDGTVVDSRISSNILFPGAVVAGFTLVFLPLSYHMFWNLRRQEYGIFLALGMSRRRALRAMALETAGVSAAALLAALAAGTACSLGFFGVLRFGLGIQGWSFTLPAAAYAWTAAVYVVTILITMAAYAVSFLWKNIRGMLKHYERAERDGVVLRMLQKLTPGYWNRNLLKFSFLRRHRTEWCLRTMLGSVLAAAAVVAVSLIFCLFGGFKKDAAAYAPYDLLYVQGAGSSRVAPEQARRVLKQHQVEVTQCKELTFMRDGAFNYVPVSQVNQKLGLCAQVEEGTFLNVFPYAAGDGYTYEMIPAERISITGDNAGRELVSCGEEQRVLWNRSPAFADRIVVLHDADFQRLAGNPQYLAGTMCLLRVQDWRTSAAGAAALQELLAQQQGQDGVFAAKVSARVWDEERARQSAGVWLFCMSFVVLMLVGALFLLIHVRIAGEEEENRQSLQSLFRQGCPKSRLASILLYKNRVRFLTPVAVGCVLGCVPGCWLNQAYGFGLQGLLAVLAGGAVWGMAVFAGMRKYSQMELDRKKWEYF